MNQDATWYGGPGNINMWTQLLPPTESGAAVDRPHLGPCLLWPIGWVDQDTTWYVVSLGPADIVLHGYPAPAQWKGRQQRHPLSGPCLLWPNGWSLDGSIKMPLGTEHTEVVLGPGDIVYCNQASPTENYAATPTFRPTALGRIATGPHFTHNPHC